MVMAFNTSSAPEFSAIRTVKADYSGATPEPAESLAGMSGKVWLTNEWNVASTDKGRVDARIWIWAAIP
jgi:hypothetical protein